LRCSQLKVGGFGKTFLAKDYLRFDKRCVVKQFIYEYFDGKQEIRELFQEEARILLKLENYSQTPNLFAYIHEKDCMVQELIQGQNLEDELRQDGKFSEQKVLDLLAEILPVLEFVHDQGIIHKDIKPSNVMRQEPSGKLVLLDFGISKRLYENQINLTIENKSNKLATQKNYSFPDGTVGYQAPDSHSSFSSDLYSLGATCVQLLTGISPENLQTLYDDSWIDIIKANISDNTYKIIEKLLATNPLDRFQTAQDAIWELENIEYIKRKNNVSLSTSLLSSPVNHYKFQAINTLAELSEDAQIAIPHLIKLLKSQDYQINSGALSTLVKIGSQAVLPLVDLLEDQRVEIRKNAISALEGIGKDALAATSKIIELLEDPEGEIRWYATIAIGKIGSSAKKAIPSLIKRLRDEKAGVRAYAAWALGKIGIEAKDALPIMLETLRDEKNEDSFLAGLEALEVIGYDITSININYENDGTTKNAKEHIIYQREEQRKSLEIQKMGGGIVLEWRRPLSANTPPQKTDL
jgi:serine/threonine protein kinase